MKNKRDLTGNLYMRNRYYDAQAGRFSQEDPIGLAGGLIAYGFAAGDPVSYADPYGLSPDTVMVGVRTLSGILKGMGNHAAIMVAAGGRRQVGELLNDDGKNYIQVRTNPSERDTGRYEWFVVPVPEGMTSEEFDNAVVHSFNSQARVVRHKEYSSHGARNSNRFVFDVITNAGGKVPKAAANPRVRQVFAGETQTSVLRQAPSVVRSKCNDGFLDSYRFGCSRCKRAHDVGVP